MAKLLMIFNLKMIIEIQNNDLLETIGMVLKAVTRKNEILHIKIFHIKDPEVSQL